MQKRVWLGISHAEAWAGEVREGDLKLEDSYLNGRGGQEWKEEEQREVVIRTHQVNILSIGL